MKKIIFSLFILAILAGQAFSATINVSVKDQHGAPIEDAKVMLITHSNDTVTGWWQPTTNYCKVGTTDSNGEWSDTITAEYFDEFGYWRNYQLLVTSHTYSPTIRQQMWNWEYGQQWVWINPTDDSTITKNATLTQNLTDGVDVDRVEVKLTNDKADKLFFGHMNDSNTWEMITDEIFYISGTPDAESIFFSNVPTPDKDDPYNAYRVNIHCPEENVGMERFVLSTATAVNINMTQGGMAAPVKVDSSQTGNVVFEGVLQSTSMAAIPDARIMLFIQDDWQTPPWQTMTDSNGYYAFYDTIGLEDATYRLEFQKQGYEGKEVNSLIYMEGVADHDYFSIGVTSLTCVAGKISGTVTLDGELLPQAHINVWGDWGDWTGDDADNYSGRGSGNINTDNGTFEIAGLAPGNYRLEVYSDFTQDPFCYNNGADMEENLQEQSGPWKHIGDDLRINIDTSTAPGEWITHVYDAEGNPVGSANDPLVVNLPGKKEAGGTISGTIKYQEDFLSTNVDLGGSGNTFIIIARQDWSTYDPPDYDWYPPACGFTSIVASGSEFNYSINVPLGYLYEIEVRSKNYGVLKPDGWDMKADLRNGVTSVTGMNFSITPGGTIKGVVYLPDGTAFKPIHDREELARNCNVNANGWGVQSWGWGEVKDDGTFEINGLVPGKYKLFVHGWGGQFKWASPEIGGIYVKPGGSGQTVFTEVEVKLKPGVRCYPRLTGAFADGIEMDDERLKHPSVIGVPKGTKITLQTMKDIFVDSPEVQFWRNDNGWWDSKFVAYGSYDFYAITGWEMCMEFRGELKGFEISTLSEKETIPNDHPWSPGEEAVVIEIDTASGECELGGCCMGKDLFRQEDVVEITKNFEIMYEILPTVMIFDADGKAKGWVICNVWEERRDAWYEAFLTGDINKIRQVANEFPAGFNFIRLHEGKYTFIMSSPNYPTYVAHVNLAGEIVHNNVNFDTDVGPGGTISGVVKDADSGTLLGNVTVMLTSRVKNKTVMTDSAGAYEFYGLGKGKYTIEVSKDGYALAGTKICVEKNASREVDFKMTLATGSFTGTVYWQMIPSPKVYPGARIVAYDDTFNGLYPREYLPCYSVTTDSDGNYEISGIVTGHTYKIFLVVNGKQLEFMEKAGTGDEVTGCNFVLRSEAPLLDIKSKISTDRESITFSIESLKELKTTPSARFQEGTEYDDSLAFTQVSLQEIIDDFYKVTITPPESDVDYVLRVTADDGVNDEVVVDTVFNLSLDARMKKRLKDEYAGGGDVYMDESSDGFTLLGIPTGGLAAQEDSSSSGPAVGGFVSMLPEVQISESNRNVSSVLQNLISSSLASDLYTIEMSNAQVNRDLTVSFAYDKTKVADVDSLKVYQYDSSTGQWFLVPGTAMVDPINGNVTLDVESIANASGMAAPKAACKSHFDGKKHAINPESSTEQSGMFAVFDQAPPNAKPYTGVEFKAYNFPNPFDLESKTITLTDDILAGTQMTIRGTIIKYYMPVNVSGETELFIYNIAGEMVRRINEGYKQGGYIFYTEWDGRNDSGSSVASGVYLCMIQVDGKKKKVFKMAVIK